MRRTVSFGVGARRRSLALVVRLLEQQQLRPAQRDPSWSAGERRRPRLHATVAEGRRRRRRSAVHAARRSGRRRDPVRGLGRGARPHGLSVPAREPGDPAFVDGWDVQFTRLLVTVDKIKLSSNPDLSPGQTSRRPARSSPRSTARGRSISRTATRATCPARAARARRRCRSPRSRTRTSERQPGVRDRRHALRVRLRRHRGDERDVRRPADEEREPRCRGPRRLPDDDHRTAAASSTSAPRRSRAATVTGFTRLQQRSRVRELAEDGELQPLLQVADDLRQLPEPGQRSGRRRSRTRSTSAASRSRATSPSSGRSRSTPTTRSGTACSTTRRRTSISSRRASCGQDAGGDADRDARD